MVRREWKPGFGVTEGKELPSYWHYLKILLCAYSINDILERKNNNNMETIP